MVKKRDFNIFEIHNKNFTIAERVREDSDVRMIPYSVKMYIDEVDNGEICRDPLIQRTDDQWTRKQKSKLIEAILHNRPIGSIALAKGRAESKSYTVTSLVDGLQRTTALVDFYHNKFALDKRATPVVCRCVDEDGNEERIEIEIAGKKFSQLPDAIKIFYEKYNLTTYIHEGFTDEELDDIVFCMNNGKTPNSYQKMRFLLGSDNMRLLQPICDSYLWEESKGCKAKNDSILCCIIRTLMMMTHYGYNNLGSATMTKFADNDFEEYVKTSTINKLSTLIDELAEIKSKLTDEEADNFNSMTIPHYILGLDEFNKNNKDGKSFDEFLHAFWNSDNFQVFLKDCVAKKDKEDNTKSGGTSLYSAESVENRQYAIYDFIDEYLDMAENDNEGDEYECVKESGNISCEEARAESDSTGNNEVEIRVSQAANDIGVMQTISRSCQQASCFEQQGEEGADYLPRREQIADASRPWNIGQQNNTIVLQQTY